MADITRQQLARERGVSYRTLLRHIFPLENKGKVRYRILRRRGRAVVYDADKVHAALDRVMGPRRQGNASGEGEVLETLAPRKGGRPRKITWERMAAVMRMHAGERRTARTFNNTAYMLRAYAMLRGHREFLWLLGGTDDPARQKFSKTLLSELGRFDDRRLVMMALLVCDLGPKYAWSRGWYAARLREIRLGDAEQRQRIMDGLLESARVAEE